MIEAQRLQRFRHPAGPGQERQPAIGTVLDGLPIGEIMLGRGSEAMPTYNIGGFSGNKDLVRAYDSLPDQIPFQQILTGGGFG